MNVAQVVYETKVSAEEKAAALKLQLPENFYAYKYKPACPGCIGCRDLEDEKDEEPTKPIVVKESSVAPSTTCQAVFNNVFGKPTVVTTSAATQPGSGMKMTFGTTATPIFGTGKSTFDTSSAG